MKSAPSSTFTNGTEKSDKTPQLNSKTFWSRLSSFYTSWSRGDRTWGFLTSVDKTTEKSTQIARPADAVVLPYGPNDEDAEEYNKCTALQLWLFGYEIDETILVFTQAPNTLTILTSEKKAKFLAPLGNQDPDNKLKLKIIHSNKVSCLSSNLFSSNKLTRILCRWTIDMLGVCFVVCFNPRLIRLIKTQLTLVIS